MRNLLFVFVLAACFCLSEVSAEKKDSVIELPGFSIADGLSSNSITVLFQDNQGFLWVGTEDGLNRYDGYGFKVFRHDPGESSTISGNFIQAITQDKAHNLWIGTRDGGLSRLDYKTGQFCSFLHDENDDSTLPGNDVYGLLVDNRNRLWVKTEGHVSLFEQDSIGFKNYGHFLNVFNLSHSIHYPLFLESDTSLLLGTRDGLNRFNTETRQFSRFPFSGTSAEMSGREPLQDLLYLSEDHFLGATPSGLELFDFQRSTPIIIPPSAYSRNMRGTVNQILELSNGDIYLATHKGLEVFDRSLLVHHLLEKDSQVLVPHHVTALLQDESGIIWVGTRFKGLLKLNLSPPKFNSLSRRSFGPDKMESVNFQSVLQDGKGQLWLGTLNRGIYRYNPSTDRIGHYIMDTERYYADADAVNALFEDPKGRLWAGTNSGLYYFIPALNDFVEFHYEDNSEIETLLHANEIFALANDSAGSLWIGTQFGLYEYCKNQIVSFFEEEESGEGPSSNRVNALQVDHGGNVWIGTANGLDVFDAHTRTFSKIHFQHEGAAPHNIQVLSLGCDGNDRILAGTSSGLWMIPSQSDTAFFMKGNRSLPNDMINAIVTDNTNRVWVGTNKGVACVSSGGMVFNFDVFDGLPGFVFNQGGVFKDPKGTLFFGGAEGLCWVHPDSINYNLNQPKVVLTNMAVHCKGESVEQFLGKNDTVTIKYRPNMVLGIEFAALEFTQPNKNRFKIFLEGYDEDWRPVTRDNKILFSNLFPDEYVLKIMASNNDFTWNNSPLKVHLIITPPLWMSNYAYAFYVLFVIFIVQMLINYRTRHYKKVNRSLKEKTVDKKQIEAQREALSNINTSLTDSINYARRIQSAMIPGEEALQRIFPSSFVYLRPRDIVSGDFYWFHQRGSKIFVAAADCTGHGVPGAFMSIIGIDLLKNLIEVQKLETVDDILKGMNEDLLNTLHRQSAVKGVDNQVNDGMDITLMVIDREDKTFEFAGALGMFYLVRDNQILTFKGDRFSLGFSRDSVLPTFTKQQGELKEGDVLYLFSDGFPDQFGGPDLKKFKYRRFRLLLLNIHRLGFADQKSILHQKLEEWMGPKIEQVDDVLVIGLKPL